MERPEEERYQEWADFWLPRFDAVYDDIAAAALGFAGLEGHAALPDTAVAQLQAPLRDGGFGMYSCADDMPAAAYLASAALAQRALKTAHEQLQPFKHQSGTALRAVWDGLCARHDDLLDPGAELSEEVVCSQLPSLQKKLARNLSDAALQAALADAPRDQCATRRSAACHAASGWLTAKPVHPQHRMRDGAFRASVKRRLGMSAMPTGCLHARCACNKPATELGPAHPLNCNRVRGLVVQRHDQVAAAIKRAMTRAGLSAVLEPHLSAFGGRPAAEQLRRRREARDADESDEARGDVLCVDEMGETLVVDVVVVNVLSSNYVAAAAAEDGAAAARKDAEKTAKYAARGDAGYKFVPFSVESLGRLGKPALALLTKLGRLAAERSHGTLTVRQFVDGVLQEISVIVNNLNSRMENAVSSFVLRPAGGEWSLGSDVPSCEVSDGM